VVIEWGRVGAWERAGIGWQRAGVGLGQKRADTCARRRLE